MNKIEGMYKNIRQVLLKKREVDGVIQQTLDDAMTPREDDESENTGHDDKESNQDDEDGNTFDNFN